MILKSERWLRSIRTSTMDSSEMTNVFSRFNCEPELRLALEMVQAPLLPAQRRGAVKEPQAHSPRFARSRLSAKDVAEFPFARSVHEKPVPPRLPCRRP